MINVVKEKNHAPEQAPEVRIHNFEEVAGGYDEFSAIREAMRCLKCRKKPCMMKGCPTKQNIPEFIAKVAEGDFEAAYEIITDVSNLPQICSRVCPHENQCEGSCAHGVFGEPVAIGKLERFVCDWHEKNCGCKKEASPNNGHKVAVVGAGPAGLSCAKTLALKGYDVTVFDSFDKMGGVLVYGIPQFRLPKEIVDKEVEGLKALGVKFVPNRVVESAEEVLGEGFESVFVGVGAGVQTMMNIPGEELKGVVTAQEYLEHVNMIKAYGADIDCYALGAKKVAVIGGGNVAMDACRCAKRMGAEEVSVIYRRSLEESPACSAEINEAMEEAIDFKFLTNPVKILGKDAVTGIECVKMELGEPDESGRRKPVAIEGSNFELPVDLVILAIGSSVDPAFKVVVDENQAVSETVFAGGDVVTGPATVVKAMKAGKDAAEAMAEKLK